MRRRSKFHARPCGASWTEPPNFSPLRGKKFSAVLCGLGLIAATTFALAGPGGFSVPAVGVPIEASGAMKGAGVGAGRAAVEHVVSPLVGLSAPSAAETIFEGEVDERIDVGPYRYFAIASEDGVRRWVTTMGAQDVEVGEHVRARSFGSRPEFFSKRLSRTFDRMHFAIVRPSADL